MDRGLAFDLILKAFDFCYHFACGELEGDLSFVADLFGVGGESESGDRLFEILFKSTSSHDQSGLGITAKRVTQQPCQDRVSEADLEVAFQLAISHLDDVHDHEAQLLQTLVDALSIGQKSASRVGLSYSLTTRQINQIQVRHSFFHMICVLVLGHAQRQDEDRVRA